MAATASVTLTDHAHPAPAATLIGQYAGWLTLSTALSTTIALGIAALLGSQTIAIAALLAWQLIITPSLVPVGSLGASRDIILGSALDSLHPGPFPAKPPVAMSTAIAVAIIAAWTLVPLWLGARAIRHRDA